MSVSPFFPARFFSGARPCRFQAVGQQGEKPLSLVALRTHGGAAEQFAQRLGHERGGHARIQEFVAADVQFF